MIPSHKLIDYVDSRMTLLEELKALSKRLEAVCDKVKRQDCPANSDVPACRYLAIKINQAVGDLCQAIPEYRPDEKEKRLYERASKALGADQVSTKTLNKHLSFIFQGPEKSSDFDSDQRKRRKNEVRERCSEIRHMSPQAILWWAKAFTPSVWSEDLMSRRTFQYLLHQMSQHKVPARQSDYDVLTLIETKDPLKSCPDYRNFTRG